jgi:hypothetical protein
MLFTKKGGGTGKKVSAGKGKIPTSNSRKGRKVDKAALGTRLFQAIRKPPAKAVADNDGDGY